VVSNALISVAVQYKVMIEQHYLEKGYTQMELDSVHTTIEHQLRNKPVYLPTDYVGVCREACVKNPYKVKCLKHDYFKSYVQISYYKSIRPGYKTGDPVVTDTRCLLYPPEGLLMYKLLYSEEWQPLPKKPSRRPFQPTKLYSQ